MSASRTTLAIIAVATSAFLPRFAVAQATWAPGVIAPPAVSDPHEMCPDAEGGVYIGWTDERNISVTLSDVFATRITAAGTVAAGFPATGFGVCVFPNYQNFCSIVPDAQGGALLYWLDGRNVQTDPAGFRLYASRITASGEVAPGWTVNGVDVSGPLIGDEICPAPVADGDGGGYFFWDNYYTTGNSDVYCLHLTATGVPAPGWPAGGLPIATGTGVDNQYADGAVSDGKGGVILVWGDQRLDAPGGYAQRVMPDGTFGLGWPASGVHFAPDGAFDVVSDGAGGFYASLGLEILTGPNAGFLSTSSIIRVTGSGQIALGWTFGGNVVCDTTDVRTAPQLAGDGEGGVLAQWDDYRNGNYASTFAVRMGPDGTFMPGWIKNGLRVSTLETQQNSRAITGDGMGGIYSAFESQSSSANLVGVQHLAADGSPAPGWSLQGTLPTMAFDQFSPTLAPDGTGGAYVAWDDDAQNTVDLQHYLGGGVVATLLSLVSADASPRAVTLTWASPSALTLTATVERRTESSAWQAIGAPSVLGTQQLRYEDRSVTAGARYDYRLVYFEGTSKQYSSETWVDVPQAAVFALEGARPNPAVDHMSAAFSLDSDAPASLTLLDVMGREVSRHEVGALGAGPHTVSMDVGVHTPPGLYWIRLTQGARSLLARAVVIR